MPLTDDVLRQIADVLAEYSVDNAAAARVAENDACCMKPGENKEFFTREAARLREEACRTDELWSAVMRELERRGARK